MKKTLNKSALFQAYLNLISACFDFPLFFRTPCRIPVYGTTAPSRKPRSQVAGGLPRNNTSLRSASTILSEKSAAIYGSSRRQQPESDGMRSERCANPVRFCHSNQKVPGYDAAELRTAFRYVSRHLTLSIGPCKSVVFENRASGCTS